MVEDATKRQDSPALVLSTYGRVYTHLVPAPGRLPTRRSLRKHMRDHADGSLYLRHLQILMNQPRTALGNECHHGKFSPFG